MDNPSDFVDRLVQPFWQYFLRSQYPTSFRLSLAAKCIGVSNELKYETQDEVINLLCKIIKWEEKYEKRYIPGVLWCPIVSNTAAMRALGETNKEKAAEFLGDFLTNHACPHIPCVFCQDAFEALETMPKTEKILNSLLFAALWHEDKSVKFHAADVLRENMTQELALKLVKIMLDRDEKYYIREQAIHITCGDFIHINFATNQISYVDLKHPGIVIDPLIQMALQEKYEGLGGRAARALGYYNGEDKEEKIVNPLITALLKNHDADIRANAVYALVFQFIKKARNAIILALDDVNEKVRIRAAYCLKLVGRKTLEEENEDSAKLSKLFNDENTDVRIDALWTFGSIRKNPTSEEVTQLINLLKDENPYIRWGAARALGFLKAKSALSALIQMVWDEKYVYPWAYAIWAAVQIEPVFSEVVKENGWEDVYIKDLQDDDAGKRVRATEILGKIGTEKSLPVLKELCKDYKKKSGKEDRAIDEIEARIRP